MRVLAVGSMYPPHHLGGYELVWQAAMARLAARGHAVRVLCADLRLPGREGEPESPDVFRELPWYWRDHAFPRTGPLARLRTERRAGAALSRHLAAFRPDVVSWWSVGGLPVSLLARARAAGLPSAAFVHDDWPLYAPLVDAWHRIARRTGLRAASERLAGGPASFRPEHVDRWVFVSHVTRRRVESGLGPLPSAEVAPSGIDARLFRPAAEQPWGWRLLVAGRLDRRKGIDTAIEALALLPGEAVLTVAGGGDPAEAEHLRRLSARRGVADRTRFVGNLDRPALAEAYAAADVVLFPVRWEEPWGLVPLEAMAAGRPVVASGRGGSAEYLRHEHNALLAPPEDAAAVAASVRRLAGDASLRARLRAGGLATAAEHTEERFGARVETVLAELAATPR